MMKERPLFSIIVPLYNAENCCSKCLDSVLSQSFDGFELVLVDDGSTDHTWDICREYASSRPNVKAVRQKNGGPGAARNTGIRLAEGEYILFCDSDDWWNGNDVLQALADRIAERPETDVIVYASRVYSEQLGTLQSFSDYSFLDGLSERYDSGSRYLEAALEARYDYRWYPWAYGIRKRILDENGITFPAYRLGEDTATMYKILTAAGPVQICRRELYVYRKGREGSLTKAPNESVLRGVLEVAEQCIEDVRAREDLPNNLKRLLCNNFAVSFFTVMILTAHLGRPEKERMLLLLEEKRWIMEYAYSPKQAAVARLVNLLGMRIAVEALGVRRAARMWSGALQRKLRRLE